MKKLFFALAAVLFAACATDVTEDVAIEAPETLKVSFEESSRIQLQNGKTVWTEGDLVSVFYKSYENMKWKFAGKTGDRTGTLLKVSGSANEQTMDNVVVAYPYSDYYSISLSTGGLVAFLPAEQTYMADSYGVDGNIMVSQSEYKQFVLKSVCGWVKIQLTGNGEKVQSINLKGNNGEQVAGEIYINTADATTTLASAIYSNFDNTEVGGTMLEDNTILTEVTLNCGEGVTLGKNATAFYIALPPQEFSKGLTVEVACSDGSTMTKSTEKTITIERNTIQPMAALTYDGVVPEVYELAYTTNDGEPLDPYTTEGFGANFVENIFDPATGKGALKFDGRVTTIPVKAFVACSNLTQIELTKNITAINAEAFSGCRALAVMDIPQGVKTIGDKAFYNCSGMTEITIPSSVTSIGTSSFEGCGGKANINCKINSSDFENAKFTEVIISNNITSIGNYALKNCTSLTSVTIPNSVTNIVYGAFEYCTSLTSITIPDSVTEIEYRTFCGCTSLTSVTIGDSVTSIGECTFEGCSSLTSVTIPDSVTSIGDNAFNACTSLKEVYYNGDLSAWCKINFRDYDANPMFYGAKLYLNGVELTEATIPSNVTEIKYCTFSGCASLKNVTFHKRITSIGDYAFYKCTSLTSVAIPNSVTEIGGDAFRDCTLLTSVTIGDSIASIGDSAFNGCTSLTSVTIPDSVTWIGGGAFEGCTSLASVTIPNSVTEIGYGAFANCTSLASVTIPDRVTSIGGSAFEGCTSLTSVTIGDRVTEIGHKAIYNCTSLKEVYCKPTTPPSGDIDFMFSYYYCSNGFCEYCRPTGCTIYVPRASVDAYKAAWSSYKSDIEPYDFE